ncbi:hypothetical protein OS493_023936 [Desmophyllum pertusum]|uniref:G-protein coupled receptors family 1 profile domain-containing protein n=1 Tax=Desmophyllum pertusum TaxID=174260 RepID=A0A9W9YAI3_9CNID|nr:hypothetical protein OS493_023936 [Desmophyllum pertusum]
MNNNSSVSSSSHQSDVDHDHGIKALSKLLPIAIAITLTNGLVFVMLYKRKSLRTPSNYLLLGLAICDFLTGAINIPYFIVFSFYVVPPAMFKDFAYWMYSLHTLMAVSAGYHILAITAEKYLAISRPLRHHLHATKKKVFKISAGIWMTSTLIAVIPLVWNESSSRLLWYIIHASVCLFIVFLVPYVFMIYAFTFMFRVISKRQRPRRQNNYNTSDTRSRLQAAKKANDRKCIVIFAIMATMFAFCWLPYFTLMLISYVKEYQMSHFSAAINSAFELFAIVRYMTSVTNPLLYTFFKRDFWLALKTILGFRRVNLPSMSRARSLSLRHTNDVLHVRSVSIDSNFISLVSWNPVTAKGIGLQASSSQTISEELSLSPKISMQNAEIHERNINKYKVRGSR